MSCTVSVDRPRQVPFRPNRMTPISKCGRCMRTARRWKTRSDLRKLQRVSSFRFDEPVPHFAELIAWTPIDANDDLLAPNVLIQNNRCLNGSFQGYPRCGPCVGKQTGSKCLFINWRLFPVDPHSGEITGPPYFGNIPLKPSNPPQYPTPSEFNRTPTTSDAFHLQQTVVRWLLPLLAREVQHVFQDGALCKQDDDTGRLICDFCATTVFGGSWACSHCAKEYCFDCKGLISQFKTEDLEASTRKWNKDPAWRLLKCTTLDGILRAHYGSCLIPVTRYSPSDLKRDWAALVGFVTQSCTAYDETLPDLAPDFQRHLQAVSGAIEASDKAPLPGQEAEEVRLRATLKVSDEQLSSYAKRETGPMQPTDRAGLETHAFFRLENDHLSDPIFDAMWSKGVPIVVDGIGERFKLDWTPQDFHRRMDGAEKKEDRECSA